MFGWMIWKQDGNNGFTAQTSNALNEWDIGRKCLQEDFSLNWLNFTETYVTFWVFPSTV